MSMIKENMPWPPLGPLNWRMMEHSAWYSGDAETLANFYTQYLAVNVNDVAYPMQSKEKFWARQIKNQGEIFVHVPIAGDLAETSASFLFGESPTVKVPQAHEQKASETYKKAQENLDKMLLESSLFRKILEGAETCAAIGGVFIKIAWDDELSPYPIPVLVQPDRAIPEFKFGILTAVTFWKIIEADESGSKVYRLLERYEKGCIKYSLYKGTTDRLGSKVSLSSHPESSHFPDVLNTVDELLAVYIPNVLPNRLDRNSYLGRSDYLGVEGLMDSLDEVYSSWIKDIALSQAKILLPESYLRRVDGGGFRFNLDKMLYVKLDIDPISEGDKITPQQFSIRAEEFEKTSLNLLERITSSAGYSPQSFGLKIDGRAESGTALMMRERKSFSTKAKKELYWESGLSKLIKLMILVYSQELNGDIEPNIDVNVAFADGVADSLNEVATSVKMISDAQAASTETKVRYLHPEWTEDQIKAEVDAIIQENNITSVGNPDENYDLSEMNYKMRFDEED